MRLKIVLILIILVLAGYIVKTDYTNYKLNGAEVFNFCWELADEVCEEVIQPCWDKFDEIKYNE